MIVQLVQCDRCKATQQEGEALPEGATRIRQYSIGTHYRHLCATCLQAEQELLAQSVWADAFGISDKRPAKKPAKDETPPPAPWTTPLPWVPDPPPLRPGPVRPYRPHDQPFRPRILCDAQG